MSGTSPNISSDTTRDCPRYRSQEGSQFVKGFGGIGGLLRYKVEFQDLEFDEEGIDYDYEDYL